MRPLSSLSGPPDAQPVPGAGAGRVWVADDSAQELAHARELLAGVYAVETFADGASLLEQLSRPDAQLPELLLLDWHMPGVSGLEVCRFLRERLSPVELPILVLTASTHAGALEEAFAAGANDFVAKPARGPELLARVRTQLQVRQHAEALRVRDLERERLLGEVEAARVRLTSLLENAPALICTFRGPELVYEFSNPLHARLVGEGRQLVGRPVREAVPEAVEQGVVALLERVYRSGEPYFDRELSLRLDRRGDGVLVDAFVNVVYQPARDADGQVVGVDVFGFEVTEQVRSRQRVEALAAQLGQSEERLRRVVEASGTATWELDAGSRRFSGDAQQLAMLGGAEAPPPPTLTEVLESLHPEDRERAQRAIDAAFAGEDGGRYRVELRTRPAEGVPSRWLEGRGQALFDADGRPLRLVGTSVDITARKEADGAREELLESLLAQPLFGATLLRGDALVVERVNATFRQLVGGRDVAGRPLMEALPELAGQGFEALLHTVQRTHVPYVGREMPGRVDRKGRGVVEDAYYDQVYQPVRRPGTALTDVLILTHDVTEMVRARQESERLVALEQQRAGFEQQLIGIVSHDLRNPVAAIMMGAATILRRPDVEERQRRSVERILGSASRANRMIHDLLDFTQARLGGGLQVQRTPGDLHVLVRQVVEESQVAHPERTLRLQQTGSGEGAWDADRLAQLVSNLLSNALAYSPHASPVLIETRGEPDALVLSVHNLGAPIPPDVLPSLFQPLQRGEGAVSAARSVGLGLYIVDQVVRAHGGHVEVSSTAEAGTTFTVHLPRA